MFYHPFANLCMAIDSFCFLIILTFSWSCQHNSHALFCYQLIKVNPLKPKPNFMNRKWFC